MNFQELRSEFFEMGCFASNQVYAWQPGFDKNNLGRWVKRGYLIKLKNGFYSFPEYLKTIDFAWYIANRIYKPSYISLHTALAFYGLIPESVVQITSVTTLKTSTFTNAFGTYSYKSVSPDMMFGYDARPLADGRTMLFAKPEKALLDLLYLYPFYTKAADFEELRLDSDLIQESINPELLTEYAGIMAIKALERRVITLLRTYGL